MISRSFGLPPGAGDVSQAEVDALDAASAKKAANLSDLANAATARTNIGLGNVTNTSDANKPVSTAQQTALNLKVDKAGRSVNVKDYGAVGDLVADDTAEIQAAIDAVSAAGGGVVYFPKGDYKVTSAVTVPTKVHLQGAGPLVSKIRTTTNNHNVLSIQGTSALATTSQIRIADLGIIGPGKASGSTGHGIYIKWASAGLEFKNLYVATHGAHGIFQEDSYTISYRDVWFADNGGDGFHGETNINHTVWERCFSMDNAGAGYKVIGGAAGVMTCCDAEGNTAAGIDLRYTHGYSIVGAELEQNGQNGTSPNIYLHWRTNSGEPTAMTTITGSVLTGTGITVTGILVDGANLTDIRGNWFNNHVTNHIQTSANAARTLVGINVKSGTGTELADASTSTARLDYDDTNLTLRVSPAMRFVPGSNPASLAEGQVWYSSTAPGGILVRDSAVTRTVWSGVSAAATLDFGSIAAGASASLTMTVTGAQFSMPVALGPPANLETGLIASGVVTAANTVQVRLFNATASAIDPVSNTWRAFVARVA